MNVSGWSMFLHSLYLQYSDTQATPSLDVPKARVPSTGSLKSQALCIAIYDYHSSGLLHSTSPTSAFSFGQFIRAIY